MAGGKPPLVLELVWSRDLRFDVNVGEVHAIVDGSSTVGPSPTQHAAMGLAGCMAADVVDILRKGRYDLRALRVTFSGTRAESPPRRFISIALRFVLEGSVPPEAVERAIALSRDRYCSVWHSFSQDIVLTTPFEIVP